MNVTIQTLEMKACCLSTGHTKVDRLGECGGDLPCVSSAPLHSRTQTDSVPPHQNQFPSAGSELLSVRRNLQIARKYAQQTFLFIILSRDLIALHVPHFTINRKKRNENMRLEVSQCNVIHTIDVSLSIQFRPSRDRQAGDGEEMMLTSVNARSNDQLPSLAHFL